MNRKKKALLKMIENVKRRILDFAADHDDISKEGKEDKESLPSSQAEEEKKG